MQLKVNELDASFTVNMADALETVRPYMLEPESDPEWEESAESTQENPAEQFSMVTILCDIVTLPCVCVFVCVYVFFCVCVSDALHSSRSVYVSCP